MSALALPDLAEAIEREHQAAHQAARTALEHALECGRLLIQAKGALPHGGWLSWLEANTSVSARQSQRYMRLATAAIEGKYDAMSHLTIEGALAAIAEPRETEEERPEPLPMAVYLAENQPLQDGEIRIPIADVLPAPEVARRQTVYPEHIRRLAKYLPDLPPIEINQRNELIDGWHRLEAHKLAGAKTIRAAVTPVKSELHHIEIFCERNAAGAWAYTLEDEEHQAQIRVRLIAQGAAPKADSELVATADDVMAEGMRLAIAALDCSGLKQAAKEYVDGICEAVDFWRKSGVPLRDLPAETHRDIKRWSRWARHRDQYEALIFNELYDATLGCLDDDEGAGCEP